MLDHANDLLDRVGKLDDAVVNLQAFRSLLEELNARIHLPPLGVDPVRMVKTGILRSTIALVMAILDSKGRDRASLGQIVELLKDRILVEFFLKKHSQNGADTIMTKKLEEVSNSYHQISTAQSFLWVQQLRNVEIGHLLMVAPITTVRYSDVYTLADEIERQVITLYEGLGMAPPHFIASKRQAVEHAKLFWQTYFAGRDRS